jgi:hypothetical protein
LISTKPTIVDTPSATKEEEEEEVAAAAAAAGRAVLQIMQEEGEAGSLRASLITCKQEEHLLSDVTAVVAAAVASVIACRLHLGRWGTI